MSHKKKIIKNYLYNLSYQLLVAVIPLVTAPYLSRTVGAGGVGVYSYYASIVAYFVLFCQLGTRLYGSREIARVYACEDKAERNKAFSAIVYVSFFSSFLALIVYFFLTIFVANKVIMLIFTFELIAAALDISWFYFGREDFKITTIRNIVVKLLTTISIFVFVKNLNDVSKYILIIALGTFISSIVLWRGVLKKVSLIKIDKKCFWATFRGCFALFIPTIATSLYKQMDKIILGLSMTMVDVGLYASAEKIPTLLLGFIGAFGTVLMPRATGLVNSERKENINNMLTSSIYYMMFVGCALGFGVAAISIEFAPLFFGPEYSYSGYLMIPIAISMIFSSWSSIVRNIYILPKKLDKIIIISVTSGAVLNLIVGLSFIGIMGSMGAVVGLVIAEITIVVVQFVFLHKKINYKNLIRYALPSLLSGISMFLILMYVLKLPLHGWLLVISNIALGALIYVVTNICYSFIVIPDQARLIVKRVKGFVKKRENGDIYI